MRENNKLAERDCKSDKVLGYKDKVMMMHYRFRINIYICQQ